MGFICDLGVYVNTLAMTINSTHSLKTDEHWVCLYSEVVEWTPSIFINYSRDLDGYLQTSQLMCKILVLSTWLTYYVCSALFTVVGSLIKITISVTKEGFLF